MGIGKANKAITLGVAGAKVVLRQTWISKVKKLPPDSVGWSVVCDRMYRVKDIQEQ